MDACYRFYAPPLCSTLRELRCFSAAPIGSHSVQSEISHQKESESAPTDTDHSIQTGTHQQGDRQSRRGQSGNRGAPRGIGNRGFRGA